jgi:hypothetical protein
MKAIKKAASLPPIKRTKHPEGNAKLQSLEIKSSHLVVNGSRKFRIDEDHVDVPMGIIDDFSIEEIPMDLTLWFQLPDGGDYPMKGFQFIELCHTGKDTATVRFRCQYYEDEWTDRVSMNAWKVLMSAAASIEAESDRSIFQVAGTMVDDEVIIEITKQANGNTIGEIIYDEGMAAIRAIEKRARAFHFVVSEEPPVFIDD